LKPERRNLEYSEKMNKEELVEGILRGDRRAVSRAISILEASINAELSRFILNSIYPHTGKSQIIGITGPPGVGKSTMIGKLCELLVEQGSNLAVLAVDASSPFTNGSILGNRIRMQSDLTKSGVYMRSLSTHGVSGGLSRAVWEATSVLEAAGHDTILVETVGAGQADLDILELADTIAVVLAPGLGDELQAIKAGIMEIGNIFIVNKKDREGAYLSMKEIEDILSINPGKGWNPPVVGTNSLTGEGFDELIRYISEHNRYEKDNGGKKRRRVYNTILMAVKMRLDSMVAEELEVVRERLSAEEQLHSRNPYEIADEYLKEDVKRLISFAK